MYLENEKEYRPEIDGLRAVAVLAILFFHVGFDWAPGGYVGVDVFFVISGYLITRNIANQIKDNKFTFSAFYIRRIKRLFPALLFTLLVTLISAYLLFSPVDLERLGKSIQYSILSISNFFFWSEAGYFNSSSEIKPLLHTWSLAIEEQFYLLWPAILFGLSLLHKKHAITVFFLIAFIVSLSLNIIYLPKHADTVFYLLPFRVFEFAIGAICVFSHHGSFDKRAIKEVLSVVGMIMIILAVVIYNNATKFPGFAALLPCIGAALIIISKQSIISHHVLSNKLMVRIGLISYSIYLIHWPLLVFYKYWKFSPVNIKEKIVLLLLSIIFGFFMCRYIERPFRQTNNMNNKKSFGAKFLLLLVFVLFISFIVQYNKGWPQRYPSKYFMSHDELSENLNRYWLTFTEENKKYSGNNESRKIIVMGNSHAVDLIYALRENGSVLNITFFNSWHQCYNFGSPISHYDIDTCNKKLTQHLKSRAWQKVDAIYLHDHWPVLDLQDLKKRLLAIRELSNAPIYIFGPKMTYTKRIPDIILSHMRMSSINEYSKLFSNKEHVLNINNQVKEMTADIEVPDIYFIDILSLQCGVMIDNCEIISKQNSEFLYFDFGHFTRQGAKELGEKLKAQHPNLF